MIHFPTTHSWTEFSLQYVKQALWVTNPALDICSGIRSAFHTGLQSCPVLPKSSHTSLTAVTRNSLWRLAVTLIVYQASIMPEA